MLDETVKEELREKLAALGRPFVLVVYDTTLEPGGEWKIEPGVAYWVRSTVTPESVETTIEHLRKTTEQEKLVRLTTKLLHPEKEGGDG